MVRRADLERFLFENPVDVSARGPTSRGGNPGRLTPTADPGVDGRQLPLALVQGGEDRPGVARG
jgi:hypothetical protein